VLLGRSAATSATVTVRQVMEAKRSVRHELHQLIDELPEAETHAARRYLEYLRHRQLPGLQALLEVPEEEEELTEAAKKRLRERVQEAEAGETVSHEDVQREFGS
jgi:hypothetical protein